MRVWLSFAAALAACSSPPRRAPAPEPRGSPARHAAPEPHTLAIPDDWKSCGDDRDCVTVRMGCGHCNGGWELAVNNANARHAKDACAARIDCAHAGVVWFSGRPMCTEMGCLPAIEARCERGSCTLHDVPIDPKLVEDFF
jgi:hypothetical protein